MWLRELIAELRTGGLQPGRAAVGRSGSGGFAEFWDGGAVGPHASPRKLVHHPQVGTMELDCDVLTVPGSDLRIVAYPAGHGGGRPAAAAGSRGTAELRVPGLESGRWTGH